MTPLCLPPVAAFVVSFFASMAGLSGGVLLLPFQVSVLGITGPAITGTNMVFNIIATPSGVYRYFREGRLIWPLTVLIVAGTAPGVILGGLIRIYWLPDPVRFKTFAGFVLLYVGVRMFLDLRKREKAENGEFRVRLLEFNWRRFAFEFQGRSYRARPASVFLLTFVVGIIGGAYGLGGGAIIAPFLVAIWGLPVHAVAGATLMGTLLTSAVGVAFYTGMGMAPDWRLGLLFGAGGMAGMYLGARTQRFVPVFWLKLMLGLILVGVAGGYLYSSLQGLGIGG